ncbi:MAG: UDP-N-acetylmuramate dehydrogenase [Chloroflexota bacterium]|nr:UDP-N-acetylmuramate dehydrogenase [Chloroflexota bacterium]
MDLREFAQALRQRGYGGRVKVGEPLSRYTSFGIGGPADLLVVANEVQEMEDLVTMARSAAIPLLVLGRGTNVLVADAGVRGLVIINACQGFFWEEEGLLVAHSGTLLTKLARWTVRQGWSGLEWAVGIPGTLGGAVVGNAGAYGGDMAGTVRWVRVLDVGGTVRRLDVEELGYGYRTSALKRRGDEKYPRIVLDVALQLEAGDPEALQRKVLHITRRRRSHIPDGASAGSVFKRTVQYPAGFLIDQVGLKGFRIGDAEISTKHANFFMNAGRATAADMRELIERAQQEVRDAFAQELEPEIEFLGEWDIPTEQLSYSGVERSAGS